MNSIPNAAVGKKILPGVTLADFFLHRRHPTRSACVRVREECECEWEHTCIVRLFANMLMLVCVVCALVHELEMLNILYIPSKQPVLKPTVVKK